MSVDIWFETNPTAAADQSSTNYGSPDLYVTGGIRDQFAGILFLCDRQNSRNFEKSSILSFLGASLFCEDFDLENQNIL